jgi:hypothetical protein
MKEPKLLDVVILRRDLPDFHLTEGHAGTVVEVYGEEAFEVEFMDREGDAVALLTVLAKDVRLATKGELKELSLPDPLPFGLDAPIGDATGLTRPVS